MSTAPLDRDTQIALMKGAKERHEARFANLRRQLLMLTVR